MLSYKEILGIIAVCTDKEKSLPRDQAAWCRLAHTEFILTCVRLDEDLTELQKITSPRIR